MKIQIGLNKNEQTPEKCVIRFNCMENYKIENIKKDFNLEKYFFI